ncbi:DUF2752 domain-containing protein [Streptomyces sp. NPDC049577]|uniref:DUF2752 domain-containing protein n=1 Tax=Streptomyces sp. NPDC049577 TaxID=3155153 RepID=UPI00343C1B65
MAAPLGVAAALAAAVGYVAAFDPGRPGPYPPPCPLLHYAGLYCPGCGGLRGLHALAHGDLARAAGCNALALAGYAVFAALWVIWLIRAARHGDTGLRIALRAGHWWTVGAVIAAFTVVRNLPWGAALAP